LQGCHILFFPQGCHAARENEGPSIRRVVQNYVALEENYVALALALFSHSLSPGSLALGLLACRCQRERHPDESGVGERREPSLAIHPGARLGNRVCPRPPRRLRSLARHARPRRTSFRPDGSGTQASQVQVSLEREGAKRVPVPTRHNFPPTRHNFALPSGY
jgi:hypothetical protein